jgi:hypothetical protein
MALAPYQLLVDISPIDSASRTGSTVTITTSGAHGLTSGAYVQISGVTGTAGSTMNGSYQITVTTSTKFTYTSAGTAGTGTVTSAVASVDVMNPLTNYATVAARQSALWVDLASLNLTANGDGSGATMGATIFQEVTPAGGPWFSTIPDQSRVRFAIKDTGSTPGTADILFLGYISAISARLNENNLGTESDLTINDVNTLLDRMAVFGRTAAVAKIVEKGARRDSNVATLTTAREHGFVAGQQIAVANVTGGNGSTFNTDGATIIAVPTSTTFTYANSGLDCLNQNVLAAYYTVTRDGTGASASRDSLIFTLTSGVGDTNQWVKTGDSIGIRLTASFGGSGNLAAVKVAIADNSLGTMKMHSGANVTRISDTSFRLKFQAIANMPATFTGFVVVGQQGCRAWDSANTSGEAVTIINSSTTETDAVKKVLKVANNYHATDYAFQRLISTSDTSLITGGTAYTPPVAYYFPSGTLRSALDSIVETYQSDTKSRRYYVNTNAQLVYELADPTSSAPTFPTAPYKIVTENAGTPNTTTAAASVAPYDLQITWDHETIKRAQFNVPTNQAGMKALSTVYLYTDVITDSGDGTAQAPRNVPKYDARAGAPITEAVVDFPNASETLVPVAAAAYFLERFKPLLAGSFTLKGGGTAAHNILGFFQGYRQTGASTFALASWQPGQWVDVTSSTLNLSGQYRVEQVSLSLEPGSYTQVVNVSFNRKNPIDVATLIANQRR